MIDEKDVYVKRMKAELDRWNGRIEELEAKATQMEAEARRRTLDEIGELKQRRDRMGGKIEEMKNTAGDAWKEVHDGAERIGEELRDTVGRLEETVR